jgi:hypothetical protein
MTPPKRGADREVPAASVNSPATVIGMKEPNMDTSGMPLNDES